MPSPFPETTYGKIASHATAYALFEEATKLTDGTRANHEGRTVTERDEALYEDASDAESDALLDLLNHTPRTTSELRRWAGYLLAHLNAGNEIERGSVVLMLAALTEFSSGTNPSAVTTDQVSPELRGLIAAHRRLWAAYDETCDAADPLSKNFGGDAAREKNDAAQAIEEEALAAIVAYPSKGPADDHAKGEYFNSLGDGFETYASSIIKHLLAA